MNVSILQSVSLSAAIAVICLLGGCVSDNLGAPGEEYEILRNQTPFYVVGPQLGRRADDYLEAHSRVTLLRKEMGYSLVRLEDERTGYVANEALVAAPPRPKPRPEELAASTGSRRSGGVNESRYRGEQVNDTPLPNLPPPDLNIAPEDIIPADSPIVPSTGSPTPAPTPSFRY